VEFFPWTFVDIHNDSKAICLDKGAFRERGEASWRVFSDVVLLPGSNVVISQHFVYWPTVTMIFCDFPGLRTVKVEQFCKEAMLLVHRFCRTYFHVLCETFPLLAAVPKHLISRSIIFSNGGKWVQKQISDLFALIDCPPRRVEKLRQPIHVQSLYAGQPNIFLHAPPLHFRAVRLLMLRKLGLENVIPTYLLSVQRESDRKIRNFDALVEAGQRRFPNIRWVTLLSAPSISKQIEIWSAAKVVLAVSGSSLCNLIWMRPKTAMVTIQTGRCDRFPIRMAQLAGVKPFVVWEYRSWKEVAFTAKITELLDVIGKALKFLDDNGYWVENVSVGLPTAHRPLAPCDELGEFVNGEVCGFL
jgi:hypothetical protein